MDDQIVFTDRYQALGIAYPDPATMCKGQCEGTGWYPLFDGCSLSPYETCKRAMTHFAEPAQNSEHDTRLWREAHAKEGEHSCDGWHFVKCPDCDGTGKARP